MYEWRRMSPRERREALADRRNREVSWHGPAHFESEGPAWYLFTAACFEHKSIIGTTIKRLSNFEEGLLELLGAHEAKLEAWVVLPNHYHFLAQTSGVRVLLAALGQFHGRTSFRWNGEESTRGRQVWHRAAETVMKSDAHLYATLNYIHHNPVKHGLVSRWTDWPFSSAARWLENTGRKEAEQIWRRYPIEDYGKGWDE